jgi:alkyl sulfatase BDS1-like metallo-beta-lactamase superfamily hydrolase
MTTENLYQDTPNLARPELEGDLKATNLVSFIPPDVARYTPARNIIETLPVRLDAEKAKDLQMALAFDFTDMGEQYSLEIRRGVAVFSEGLVENAVVTLQITHDVFVQFLLGEIGRDEAITAGEIKVAGDQNKALAFFTYFDPPGVEVYPVAVR